jgi:hypothetical protein
MYLNPPAFRDGAVRSSIRSFAVDLMPLIEELS